MSDLAAAAAAMGVPEVLVKRSAEARARATGVSVDEILAAWAGGGEAPAAKAVAATPAAPEQGLEPPASSPTPEPVGAAISEESLAPQASSPPQTSNLEPQTVLPRVAVPAAPPVLVGEHQGVGVVMTGSFGLLILSLLLSVFLPSMRQPGNGIRSSNHSYSSEARAGQAIYASQGCATCHTQVIRNVVTDVGLGPVTLDDTNQVIGHRRIGPDLAAIGARLEDPAALVALVSGDGNHPAATGLSDADLANLIAYLREST